MARKTKAQIRQEQAHELRQWITIVILSAFIIIGLLKWGIIGAFLYNLQRYLFGNLFWLILALFIALILMNMMNRHHGTEDENPVPAILIAAGIMLLCTYLDEPDAVRGFDPFLNYIANFQSFFAGEIPASTGGGVIGALLYSLLSMAFGRAGVLLVIIVLFIIVMLLLVSLDVYKKAFSYIVAFFRRPEREEEEEEEEEEPEEEKPQPNLWNMLAERKEKKMLGKIRADDDSEKPEDQITILTEEKPEEPKQTSIFNISADGQTEEIPVVKMPGKVISGDDSIFISVDDLYRDHPQDEEEEYEYEDDEEVYDEYEDEYEEEEAEDLYTEQLSMDLDEEDEEEETPPPAPRPRRRNKVYRLPGTNLLDPLPPKDANHENEEAAAEKGELLINILHNFDIESELLDTHIGPSVTQFEIRPDVNVKVSKILGLTDNIKMQLAAKDVRIEAPIPGRNAVGVEIPNIKSTPVKMRELYSDIPEKEKKQPLLFLVGKDLLGRTVTCRLDKMPHLLIAGATGSGKSVCMNSIITSLLLRTKPDDVKMLLIDPKKVEFTPYHNVPHLIGPVINDPNKANNALKVIVRIMDERYNIFSSAGVRNIEVFNQKVEAQGGRPNPDGSPAPKKMPYIVVIIDELADLMAVAGKEVELSIQRITQLARAAGIHLIVATQRPSVDVITGIIKANIPSRIAFAVSSGTDSRTILDHVGAERLLGNGDMLYMPIGQNSPMRVQGVFVTDDEVKRITDYVSAQATPMYDDSFVMLEGVEGNEMGAVATVSDDPLFQEIKQYVIEAQKASTSLLQRRFGIGYNRAARVIDQLESDGVIGPANGSKPREVYIKPES